MDKSGYALRLIREGKHYFLFRPRCSGKSLFVDTLQHLLEGRRDVFVGLKAYDQWGWSLRYPVVRFDFAGLNTTRLGDVEEHVRAQQVKLENSASVQLRHRLGHTLSTSPNMTSA